FSDGAGLFRLFSGEVATEIAWLLPTAIVIGLALLWFRRHAPGTDGVRAQAILWLGWLLVAALLFSLIAGLFHQDSTVALAPAIGALVGMGAAIAWRERHRTSVVAATVAALIGSAAWIAALLQSTAPSWLPLLPPIVTGGAVLAAIGVVAAHANRDRSLGAVALGAGLAVLLLTPAIASVATAAEPHTGAIPTAVPTAQNARGGPGGLGGGRGGFGPPGGGFTGQGGFGPPPGAF